MFRGILRVGAVLAAAGATLFADSPATSLQRAMRDRYRVTVTNQKLKTGGLVLDSMDLEKLSDGAETWEKVIRKLRGEMMPPQACLRLDQATLEAFVTWLEEAIDRAAAARQNPSLRMTERWP